MDIRIVMVILSSLLVVILAASLPGQIKTYLYLKADAEERRRRREASAKEGNAGGGYRGLTPPTSDSAVYRGLTPPTSANPPMPPPRERKAETGSTSSPAQFV